MIPPSFDRETILRLIPHQGRSCLLDRCLRWTDHDIVCTTTAHRDPGNPLRRNGRLHAVCGAEIGMQAAALHGALCAGPTPRRGMIVSLRDLRWAGAWLDDAEGDMLQVQADLEARQDAVSAYRFRLSDAGQVGICDGRGMVSLSSSR